MASLEVDLEGIERAIERVDAQAVLRAHTKAMELGLTDREIVEAALAIVGTTAGALGDDPDFSDKAGASMLVAMYMLIGTLVLADDDGQIIEDAEQGEQGEQGGEQ